MSFLEYNVKSTPTGWRKILHLNWALALLVISVASVGFLMLFSVAGGSLSPWAEPQMQRFALGFLLMLAIAMVPIWFWRNMAASSAFSGATQMAQCGKISADSLPS